MDHERFLLSVDSVSHLGELETLALTERFRDLGFVVIRPHSWMSLRQDLLALSRLFGSVVDHVLADEDGVVVIEPRAELARFGHAFTRGRLEIHTDGAFNANPPSVVAMQCETAPPAGGATCLVDGEELYRHLLEHGDRDIEPLFAPNAMTIVRAGECASQPVFERHGDRVQICFRLDDAVDVAFRPEVEPFLARIRSFLQDPANQIRFHMTVGDIVVLDNRRILHGREALAPSGERRLNRVWFDGQSQHELPLGFRVNAPDSDRRPRSGAHTAAQRQ